VSATIDQKRTSASVTVVKGNLNDTLTIKVKHLKPGLAFDLFTVENSRFLSNGSLDPAFVNFGLAWYQSDLQVGKSGTGSAKIQTILANQIFGFDPEATLAPTNTFHVGFWFNNPPMRRPAALPGLRPSMASIMQARWRWKVCPMLPPTSALYVSTQHPVHPLVAILERE
jgi:hypothetical protein